MLQLFNDFSFLSTIGLPRDVIIADYMSIDFKASPPIQSLAKAYGRPKDEKMDNLWLVLFWSGPIGIGIFLVCLGSMIYLLAKADALKKSGRQDDREK